jgi:hypothetical protein
MRITADQNHAGLRDPLLWPDNMHYTLAWIIEREMNDAEFRRVPRQGLDPAPLLGIADRSEGMALGRHTVVGRREHLVWPAHGKSTILEKFKCVNGAVVGELACDMQQSLSVAIL